MTKEMFPVISEGGYRFGERSAEALLAAKNIKGVAFDFDGVFTDNCLYHALCYDGTAPSYKRWCYADGLGVSLLKAVGLPIAIITQTKGQEALLACVLSERWGIDLATGAKGRTGKLDKLYDWLALKGGQGGLRPGECAVMGDDLADVEMIREAGLAAAPISADPAILSLVHFISARPGGAGAVRDFANFILWARGIDPLSLPCA